MATITGTPTGAPAQMSARKFLAPPADITETRDAFVITAEIPGVPSGEVSVSLTGNTLTIEARRSGPTLTGVRTLHRESVPLDFQRSFELSPAIDTSRIRAEVDQGLLKLCLPKAVKAQPQKVRVE